MSTREVPVESNLPSEAMAAAQAALRRPLADYYLVIASAGALAALGLYMVMSASSVLSKVATTTATSSGNPYSYGFSQMKVALVGVAVAWLLSRLSRRVLTIIALVATLLAIGSLALVILPGGPGVVNGGQRAWLALGPLPQLQPSEFAKPAMILWSGVVFAQPARARAADHARSMLVPYLPVALLVLALIVAEKDLGTAMIVGVIIVAQLWFAGAPGKTLGLLGGAGAVGVGVMIALSAHRRAQVLGFVAQALPFLHLPFATDSDQPQNAIYALATGGWWGVGPGASRQKWGGLYNGAHTDYILAVTGEELGLFGILVVLMLVVTLLYTGLRIARRCDTLFWRLIASGVTAWFLVQAGVNALVAFGLLPVLGVPFPLVSYGGSAMLAACIGVGLLLAAARHEPAARQGLAERTASHAHRSTGVVVAKRVRS